MELQAGAARAAIVGRDQELAAVERLLTDGRERFSALLLEGDAGIGKTTIFREAVRMAASDGFAVLSCRPAASDAAASLSAVGDLLYDVPVEELEALPSPQRRALEIALFRVESDGRPVDQRAVAAGLRSLVIHLAATRPLLVAIDDVQWLDPASAVTLEFVARRLGPECVGLLVTRRLGEPPRLDISALLPRATLVREKVEPLSLGALQRMLREELGDMFPRSLLVRIYETSGGNPLFALEIGRALADRGTTSAAEPLPVPDDIRELVRVRVTALPEATREALLAAALLAAPTTETLTRALGRSPSVDFEPAELAGIARLERAVAVFAHPLHAAAVVGAAKEAERRRIHRQLADSVDEPEERARHLAFADEQRDEDTARLLEEGAAAARARGGLHSAAELLEAARARTPSSNATAARARGVRAAELHLHAGDRARARILLEELLVESLEPARRADVLRLLAEVCLSEESLPEAERLLLEALSFADDPRSRARIQAELVYVVQFSFEFVRSAELAHQAVELLADSDDGPLLAEALSYCAISDYLAGRGVDWKKVDRALELEDPARIALPGLSPSGIAALLMMFVDRYAEASELIARTCLQLAERGDEKDLAHALLWRSWMETRRGNLALAATIADEAIMCAALTGNLIIGRWASAQRAWIDAHLGQLFEARRRSTEVLGPDGNGTPHVQLWMAMTLSLVESSVGDYAACWEVCRPLTEAVERSGIAEPAPLAFLPDALEALVALDQIDRAEALIDELERAGRELDRIWALATGARCRGLLLAARGDLEEALAAFERALAEHERAELPFDRARTLLAKGIVDRRARRRARARAALEEAAAEFEGMGARVWAERSRKELHRLGGRRRGTEGELTPSERRVVELAVDGLSNKEIAAALFVTVHTVEVHLSHAYTKLGVHSRSQLAKQLSHLE